MTPRARFLETALFGKPDRIAMEPGAGRASTLAAWRTQGLPDSVPGIAEATEYAYRVAGGQHPWPAAGAGFGVNERMIPEFEEKVIERKKDSQIVQDWKGNVCEIGNEYSVEYLRNAIDFVTRRWLKCPVESRADWADMRRRYDPDDPSRLPPNAVALGRQLVDRESPIILHFSGPFWQLREWLGFENLCMMFYDDPQFLREMIAFWEDYIARLLENALKCFVPDGVHLSEDMAYKSFSMISPAMTREFLLPVYRRWGDIVRRHGCPIFAMDSDGYVGELIPIWIEAGINLCDPLEVAAGNDIVEYRRRFGHKMAFRGGVDKRAIAKGGRVIAEELHRIESVVRDGGFIPGCDHGVPADVSWPDYVNYVRLLGRMTGWIE